MELLFRARDNKEHIARPATDLEFLETTVLNLEGIISNILAYVQSVLEGKIKGDPAIGRHVLDALTSLPQLTNKKLEDMFTNNLQVCYFLCV